MKKYVITAVVLLLLVAAVVGLMVVRTGEDDLVAHHSVSRSVSPCAHENWESGVCTDCDQRCAHREWAAGECIRCGTLCGHEQWQPGACAQCGTACDHPSYDVPGHSCAQCGEELNHLYEGYRCKVCAEPVEFEGFQLPWQVFAGSDRPGTIEVLHYETPDYYLRSVGIESEDSWDKRFCVYLPYGYDPAKQYDVLVLLHGMGGTEEYWLLGAQEYYGIGTNKVRTKEMLDNMIAQGLCREMIVVTPTFYQNSEYRGYYDRMIDQERFVGELQEQILPLVVETYSTYAADSNREAISAAREHFAFAGLSMGSIYGYNAVIPQCLDLFAWYGLFAGSECHTGKVADAINANPQYPISFFYNAAGTKDTMGNPHQGQYNEVLSMAPSLVEGENAAFTWIEGAYHEYRAWGTGLYNFLRIAFY